METNNEVLSQASDKSKKYTRNHNNKVKSQEAQP
jgi:hypothetical protein